MLEAREICHQYENKPLLKGINLSVEDHEVLCLLGSSGSGKSTMLRIIAGLEKPESGRIYRNGTDITDLPVHERNFGLVFQDYALFPHLTVAENTAFGLEMRHVPKNEIRERVRNALQQVGMCSFEDRHVTELSGGEQQRVALARTLVVQPELIMLDEPLGALDYSLRHTLLEELRSILGKNGIPAIYVTHDQEEAFALASRIAVLHEGRIIQTASPEALFHHPVNSWCARFLGLNNLMKVHNDAERGPVIMNFDEAVQVPSVREEGLLLLNGGSLQMNDGAALTLKGKVTSVTYRGTYYDITASVNEKESLTIHHSGACKPGEIIRIGFRSEDYSLLKDEA